MTEFYRATSSYLHYERFINFFKKFPKFLLKDFHRTAYKKVIY